MTTVGNSSGELLELRLALWQERSRAMSQMSSLDADFQAVAASSGSFDLQPSDESGDCSTVALDLDRTRTLLYSARQRLVDVDDAIRRIDQGTYGTCEVCGSRLATERLEALPAARTCVGCATGGLLVRRRKAERAPVTVPNQDFVGFAVSVEVTGRRAVLRLRGELDLLTAPELGATLDAVIDQGHRFVALELAECGFMDLSGLRVIANAAHRLELLGGTLRLRSASAVVRRVIAMPGLAHLALRHADSTPARFGPEGSVDLVELETVGERLASRLDQAMRAREVVAQAQGVIMERNGVGKEDALDLLQRFEQTRALPLVEQTNHAAASPEDRRPSLPGRAG